MASHYAPEDLHPNVVFVNLAHERLEAGDMASINEMFAADIVWHESGTSELAGAYAGRDAVMAFWKVYFSAAGSSFTQDIVAIAANDDYVYSTVALTGRKGDLDFSQTAIDVMRMRGGQIAEFWRYYEDLGQAEAFFSHVA
jgi:ketosteroid isomerase-like protein